MSEAKDEQPIIHIPVRDGDAERAAAAHPAAGVDPPVQGGERPESETVFTIDLAPAGPAAPEPPVEEPTVPRSRYLEAVRENLRLNQEMKRIQGEAYQDKVRAQTAEARATAAEAKLPDLQAQLQRIGADFQNFRRRVDKEKEEAARYQNADLLRELLPVLDNFERAMKAASQGDVNADFYKGVELIHKQLQDILQSFDLKTLSVLGEPFDPNFHEAVTRHPHETIAPDHVTTEHQKGFLYRERLLRPALVGVSIGPSEPPASEESGA